jgi:hypothetical protein
VYDVLQDWPEALACRLRALWPGRAGAAATAAELELSLAVVAGYLARLPTPLPPRAGLLCVAAVRALVHKTVIL